VNEGEFSAAEKRIEKLVPFAQTKYLFLFLFTAVKTTSLLANQTDTGTMNISFFLFIYY
jgi:hypothetical protein